MKCLLYSHTSFDKVAKVKQGNDSICYAYGYDQHRISMDEHAGNTHRTKRYVGNCEYITETTGNTTSSRWLTYLSGPTGVYAVVVTRNGTDEIHYVLKDNLGSWTAIVNSSGVVEQRLSYDAWGNLRNPDTWSGSFTGTPMFDRGYTGHEHLYDFGLVNMNGRMYDPVTSSFLSVDQYVQSPENAQGFNRYAYCMNNPLRYVDPSGWLAGGGYTGYTPNSSANAFDPYMFYGHTALEPRDLGLRELSTADPIITWMEENSLHGGGNGVKGGWYKDVDGTIKYGNDVTSSSITNGQVFLGTTYTSKDGATYYGLFGETYDLRTEQGRLGKDIDEAFINYVQYSNEMSNGLFGYSYDGSSEPIQKATNFGNIVQYNNNDNIKTYRYNDILVILVVCETKPPYPENNMNAVFCGWSSAYPTRFVNGERIETGPISISYSMSESTTFGKGYPLYFCPKGNDNPRVIMFFIDAQTRNVFNQQWNHTFGY